MNDKEEKAIRKKQLELGLSDKECNDVIENIKEFFSMSDNQVEFYDYVLKFMEDKGC